MDPFFNERAAQWAHDIVMKMDDDEAQMFVTLVTHDVLMADIENNRRTLDGHVAEIHKRLLDAADKVVSKGGSLTPVAVITDVAKAVGRDRWDRNEKGQFWSQEKRVTSNRSLKPDPDKETRNGGIPKASRLAAASGMKSTKLSPQERAAYQQQYAQLAQAMDDALNSGADGVRAILEDKSTGRRNAVYVNSLHEFTRSGNDTNWNPARQNLVAVSAPPNRNASLDLVSALGSKEHEAAVGNFSQQWFDPSKDTPGTSAGTYRRVQTGSKLISDMVPTDANGIPLTPGGGKVLAASKFGEFVGQYGPEAEKVIGPSARKAAYRYRGTEKAPDSELVRARNLAVQQLRPPDSDMSVARIARNRAAGGVDASVTPEQKAVASVAASSKYLMDRLPSMRLAEIQRKSGRIPPSEGVIIDRDGKIAVQAVGHADDHYLPFNLKNLKALRGGEYVRTRTTGGLTTEDIYTGLVSGARQVTVVSNSGVFTIDFEDDFRGVRRYNDKAASMVGRYAKTLDAIKEGQIEREKLTPEVKAEIRDEVEAEMPRSVYSPKAIEDAVRQKTKEYSDTENPSLTSSEIKAIEAESARKGGDDERTVRTVRAQLWDAKLEEKRSRYYKLDGEGYAAALESMKEQYPYYIQSVSFVHRNEALSNTGERHNTKNDPNYPSSVRLPSGKQLTLVSTGDKGYVKARHNRPDEVEEGYYDAGIAGRGTQQRTNAQGEKVQSGKTPASHTNYQNWQHNPIRTGQLKPIDAEEGEAKVATSGKAGQRPKTPMEEYKEARAQVNAQANAKVALKKLVDHFEGVTLLPEHSTIQEARDNFDSVADDKNKRVRLEQELNNLAANLSNQGDPAVAAHGRAAKTLFTALKLEEGRLGGVEYNPEAHMGQRADVPYSFTEKAYALGADENIVDAELDQLNKGMNDLGVGGLVTASDAELRDVAYVSGKLANVLASGAASSAEGSAAVAEVADKLNLPDAAVGNLLAEVRSGQPSASAERYAKIAELAERRRRINFNAAKGGPIKNQPPVQEAAQAPPPPLKQVTDHRERNDELAAKIDLDPYIAAMAQAATANKSNTANDWNRLWRLREGELPYDIDDVSQTAQAIINGSSPADKGLLRSLFRDFIDPMS